MPQKTNMEKNLQIGQTKWILVESPDKKIIDTLAKEYDFHEMIIDDILWVNAQSKLEVNENHVFLALTFTKYLHEEQRYIFNELDVIIGKDYIITIINLESESLNKLFETIKEEAKSVDGSYKSSPYYILYRIIDAFYEKTITWLARASQRLLDIQNSIGDKKVNSDIVDELVNEDFNKILIRHNFLSQEDVIDDLIQHVKENHDKQLNIYFNSLKNRLTKIINTVNILTEKNDSLMAAYNTFVGIKNNNSVTRLTFVNAIFMPLTLIAGIGGMSERSMMTWPEHWRIAYPLFLLLCVVIGFATFIIFRKLFIKK